MKPDGCEVGRHHNGAAFARSCHKHTGRMIRLRALLTRILTRRALTERARHEAMCRHPAGEKIGRPR